MPKRKTQVAIHVGDGAGGMAPVTDLRFDSATWPVQFVVPAAEADYWMAHLNAECSERGWQTSALSQLDADENSGTIVASTGIVGQSPTLEIVWERARGGPLNVRAQLGGTPALTLDAADGLLDAVRARSQTRTQTRIHRRGQLTYEGLPWRGEFWLTKALRLGPPSKHASWLVAPQVIIVDAEVEGIGWQGAAATFEVLLRELSIFLNVVVGINTTVERGGWVWTHDANEAGEITACELRPLGYWETTSQPGMAQPGVVRPIPLRHVQRPALEPLGIRARCGRS
jgi:hypothetical protein